MLLVTAEYRPRGLELVGAHEAVAVQARKIDDLACGRGTMVQGETHIQGWATVPMRGQGVLDEGSTPGAARIALVHIQEKGSCLHDIIVFTDLTGRRSTETDSGHS